MEVKQKILEELTTHYVKVEFTFDEVEGAFEDQVDEAVDAGLQVFYEKGYELQDHEEFFQKDHAGKWKGTYVAHIERIEDEEYLDEAD